MSDLLRDRWGTPQWLFDRLDREFSFVLDAAAESHNAKCEKYLTDALNGHAWPGTGAVFVNPPYSTVREWLPRIASEGLVRPVVAVLPARTETDWWHGYVLPWASEIRFIQGRVAFVPPPEMTLPAAGNRPVFASSVCVFRPGGTECTVSTLVAPRNSKLLAAGQTELPIEQ